ncbi:MAG: hypothetical protein AB1650_06560 [Candidatus Omnitrophota bacterium]
MSFDREAIIQKINDLMQRSLTAQQVYEWALSAALTADFEDFSEKDAVGSKAIKMLVDINEDRKVSDHELKVLEYYRQCLGGKREFRDSCSEEDLPDVDPAILLKWKDAQAPALEMETKTTRDKILHQLRIYVYVYASFLLFINLAMLVALGGPWSDKRSEAIMTFPFFIYGLFLLLPMGVISGARMFLASMPLFIMGMAYFWFKFFQTLFFLPVHWGNLFMYFFMGAIPASMAVGLLVYEKFMKNKQAAD